MIGLLGSGDNPGVPMAGESEANPYLSSPVGTGSDVATRSSRDKTGHTVTF